MKQKSFLPSSLLGRRKEFFEDQLNQAEKDSQKGEKYTGHYPAEEYQTEPLKREGCRKREQHHLHHRRLNKHTP